MKKIFKITGIILLALFALLLILPFAFQGKIKEIVEKEANNMLNAKIHFEKVNLSFIRNFPNASVGISDFSIVGINEFENDTLASFDKLHIAVNIKSLFGDQLEITKIDLQSPKVLAKVLPDGKVNWDIMKSAEEEETVPEDTTSTAFKMNLKKISIENAYIVYDDLEGNMKAILDNVNLTLAGNFADDLSTLKVQGDIDKLSFLMDEIAYMKEARLDAKMEIVADMKNDKYTFANNEFLLNKIKMNFAGWVQLLENGYDMDIKLNTPNVDFKDILSMIPTFYAKDFESIQAKGELQLDAMLKGIYIDSTNMPAMDIKMNVANGYIKYADLPQSIDNININMQVTKAQGDLDLLELNIPKFHFEMAKNPFDMRLKIANPMSDMLFDFGAKGILNLNMIKEVYPLDNTDITGIINADLETSGRMSQIEKEQYESIKAKGNLSLSQFIYKSEDMLPVLIDKAALNFTPRYVNLAAFDMKMGNSDFHATGNLENFIAYALKDEVLKGELNLTSTLININDFMTFASEEETTETTTIAATPETAEETMSVIEVPKNIQFKLNADLKKITFDNIELNNLKGIIKTENGKLSFNNVSINAFGGSMNADGFYSTEDIENPSVNMKLKINNVLYSEMYKQLDMVKQFAPIVENIKGNFSLDFNFDSKLDNTMSPVYPTLIGNGVLTSKEMSISNVKVLDGLATALKNDKLKTLTANDVKLQFTIANGRINTQPFDIKMGTTNMNVSGSTGLDQTIDYVAKVTMPQEIKNVPLTMNVKIGGTFQNPSIKLDAGSTINAVKDAVVQDVKAKVDESLQKLVEDAKKQRDALVAEAEKQAGNIRAEANKVGNALVTEAEKQGKKLIDEANKTSNPIAKVAAVKAAEASAKKLKSEAEKKANDLNKAADEQADKLVKTTQEQGDKLIKEAEAKAKI